MGESKAELGVMDEVKAVSRALEELNYDYVSNAPPAPSHQSQTRLTAD